MSSSNRKKQQRALSETEKKILKEAFELFDSNNDGYLDYYEFKASSRCLGFHLRKPELLQILETYARFDKNMISYEDFYEQNVDACGTRKGAQGPNWFPPSGWKNTRKADDGSWLDYQFTVLQLSSTEVEEKMAKRDPVDEIKEAFKLIANDKTNAITFRDLKHAAERVGADIPDRDLRSMIEEFDTKGEGKLDEEDFISLITGEAL